MSTTENILRKLLAEVCNPRQRYLDDVIKEASAHLDSLDGDLVISDAELRDKLFTYSGELAARQWAVTEAHERANQIRHTIDAARRANEARKESWSNNFTPSSIEYALSLCQKGELVVGDDRDFYLDKSLVEEAKKILGI